MEEHPTILWAYLHGSFLEPGPYRDIDVAVWVDPRRAAPSDWRRYELDLSVALQSIIPQPVDVRVLNDAPLAFRYHVLKGEPLLVRDRDGLDEVRARYPINSHKGAMRKIKPLQGFRIIPLGDYLPNLFSLLAP